MSDIERREITGSITEGRTGYHVVRVNGADGTWYAISRSSDIAFGLAASAASFGEPMGRGEWRVGENAPAPWAVGVILDDVIREFEKNEAAWSLVIRGVDPAIAETLTDGAWIARRELTAVEAVDLLVASGWSQSDRSDFDAIDKGVREYRRLVRPYRASTGIPVNLAVATMPDRKSR